MTEKRIDVEKLKEAIRKQTYFIPLKHWVIGYSEVSAIIDSLAQPVAPVKTEAIESLLNEYCASCDSCGEVCKDMEAARSELDAIRRKG
jgi:hypothetical protein